MPPRHLLVLDLDETLLYASEVELNRASDFRACGYYVYRRPHLAEFIAYALARFEVGVWTSSGRRYADAIVAELFPAESLSFVWARERCSITRDWTTGGYHNRKPLKKLKRRGYRLEQVIAVDDTPSKHAYNYGNLVRVDEYLGQNENDDELLWLMRYLDRLAAEPNVRRIEKRRWRERLQQEALGEDDRDPEPHRDGQVAIAAHAAPTESE
ncbi:NIF family HAD-type phosphatase [Lysobacter sp. cf310]|uniref:NIF family HAD-type phosphatase n=1 Tax=Lysobacter sp. cf310 TaxID=1761790 RepID=UPI0008F10872|nr:HAD family hydrolase [Lysobacter sp. cf310]SFK50371.1 carboxy-terminal domain RNA polymerase II polypeptide A small phosphatase [Lysobacter sp. cf310]